MILLEKHILLRGVALFREIDEEVLTQIAFDAREERVAAGEYIIKKGDIGDTFYIIVEGKVYVEDDGKTIATLGKREIFGELAVLSPEARTASIVAAEECLLLKLQRHLLIDNIGADINLAMGIIQELCLRIRNMTKQIHELIF